MTTRTVTYSPAFTLVPTYECFNRCTYCNFRQDPGTSPWLTLADAELQLRSLPRFGELSTATFGVIEILILSGEVHPQSPQRAAWFERIYDLCELALNLGFLPHTNVGPLSFAEMERLKAVNVSMGLMLEQVTPDLLKTVHRHAPSKIPDVRLQQLEWAGRLRIPFTTGLLLGLGETAGDRRETLAAIARSHQRWGHIQEVILQPYSPGQREIRGDDPFPHHQLVSLIAEARHLLPADIAIQVPPNLVQDPTWLLACLDAGARDLGGLGPKDEVNPDYPHPLSGRLRQTLEAAGWVLQPRLPIYPDYDAWLPESLQGAVMQGRSRLRQPLQPPQFC